MDIQDINNLENIDLQLFASVLFLLSNILSIKATLDIKDSIINNTNNPEIKKTAKFAVSLQLIGIIIFLILSYDEYQSIPSSENKAYLSSNVLSTVSTIIRFQTIINDPTSFIGSEDLD
jgi:hypothetical protein